MNEPLGVEVISPEDATSILLNHNIDSQVEGSENEPAEPEYLGLAAHIMQVFEDNRRARRTSGMEAEIFQSLRDYNGEYGTKEMAQIAEEGGSQIFMNLTATKARAAQSWIRDILLNASEDAFSIEPTPIPSLPSALIS